MWNKSFSLRMGRVDSVTVKQRRLLRGKKRIISVRGWRRVFLRGGIECTGAIEMALKEAREVLVVRWRGGFKRAPAKHTDALFRS